MKIFILVSTLLFLTHCSRGIPNYMGTEIQKCINCLCHARTGCFSRYNCARYSVSYEYWQTADSPVVDIDDNPNSEGSYKKCMRNENCIVTTIIQYADAIGHMDCNCDGVFDCKDRMAIHLWGAQCANPQFNSTYATRFNRCATDLNVSTMLNQEGVNCVPPSV